MSAPRYPRTLYKSPGNLKWAAKGIRKTYDSLIVDNEKEHAAAEELGYIDSFQDALFPPEEGEKPKKV